VEARSSSDSGEKKLRGMYIIKFCTHLKMPEWAKWFELKGVPPIKYHL
jgi:hypothetical protein